MSKHFLWLAVVAAFIVTPAASQNRARPAPAAATAPAQPAGGVASVAGKWTYRSFINTPDLVGGDASKALDLIFGEGVFTFELSPDAKLKGTFDMGGGFVLNLEGMVRPPAQGVPLTVEMVGNGRPGTPTAGWEYDYHGYLAYQWPNGVSQVPALVGTVIRAKPHDGAPAGFVASFVAVRQP
jgi:hypothetical protein